MNTTSIYATNLVFLIVIFTFSANYKFFRLSLKNFDFIKRIYNGWIKMFSTYLPHVDLVAMRSYHFTRNAGKPLTEVVKRNLETSCRYKGYDIGAFIGNSQYIHIWQDTLDVLDGYTFIDIHWHLVNCALKADPSDIFDENVRKYIDLVRSVRENSKSFDVLPEIKEEDPIEQFYLNTNCIIQTALKFNISIGMVYRRLHEIVVRKAVDEKYYVDTTAKAYGLNPHEFNYLRFSPKYRNKVEFYAKQKCRCNI